MRGTDTCPKSMGELAKYFQNGLTPDSRFRLISNAPGRQVSGQLVTTGRMITVQNRGFNIPLPTDSHSDASLNFFPHSSGQCSPNEHPDTLASRVPDCFELPS